MLTIHHLFVNRNSKVWCMVSYRMTKLAGEAEPRTLSGERAARLPGEKTLCVLQTRMGSPRGRLPIGRGFPIFGAAGYFGALPLPDAGGAEGCMCMACSPMEFICELKNRKKLEPTSTARPAASASSISFDDVMPLLPSAAGQSPGDMMSTGRT